jgi:dTDP-4-amino-4,6-dideoxygalactose transaminase
MNPHRVTSDFEQAIASYTGSPHAVVVDCCTNALFLCLKYLGLNRREISIPSHTYMSVPCSIIHAGGKVKFEKSSQRLTGAYRLKPTPVWDSSLRFTKNMYKKGQYMCLSFSGPKKILKLGKGGAILTDNERAYEWFKRARYNGRNSIAHISDKFDMLGWNMYMSPDAAARGLLLMSGMEDKNKDVTQEYQDLSKYEVYTQ